MISYQKKSPVSLLRWRLVLCGLERNVWNHAYQTTLDESMKPHQHRKSLNGNRLTKRHKVVSSIRFNINCFKATETCFLLIDFAVVHKFIERLFTRRNLELFSGKNLRQVNNLCHDACRQRRGNCNFRHLIAKPPTDLCGYQSPICSQTSSSRIYDVARLGELINASLHDKLINIEKSERFVFNRSHLAEINIPQLLKAGYPYTRHCFIRSSR